MIRWLIAALALAAALLGLQHYRSSAADFERKLRETQQRLISVQAQSDDYAKNVVAVTALAEGYRQRTEKVRTVTKEIVREVPKLIPVDSCALPPGWRLLHDAAARGAALDPAAASGPDAAPVAAQDAATTVIENYDQYHQLAEQVTGLQQYIREQLNVEH